MNSYVNIPMVHSELPKQSDNQQLYKRKMSIGLSFEMPWSISINFHPPVVLPLEQNLEKDKKNKNKNNNNKILNN